MADIIVNTFTVKSAVNLDTIIVSTYGDGNFIREDLYSLKAFTVSQAETDALFAADAFGILDKGNQNFYKKQQPQQPISQSAPPPTPPPPVTQDRRRSRERYIPESRYSKPKNTSGGQFVIKDTGEDYKGSYIETFDGRFYSGTKPEQNGVELVELSPNYLEDLMPAAIAAAGLLAGFFKAKLKKGDREKGRTKRYFVQDKRTNKIVETDLENYQLAQSIPSKRFATADWIIKGPAENQVINGYPFEGAASKNRKTIQALEPQMPGISAFVTDYSLLVEEPVNPKQNELYSDVVKVEDPLVELENFRKANFDQRK